MKESELNEEIKEVLLLYAGKSNQAYDTRKHYPKGIQGIDKVAKYILSNDEYEIVARKMGLESCEKRPYTPYDCNNKKVTFFATLHHKKTPIKEICNELGYKKRDVMEILRRGILKLKDYNGKIQDIGEDEAFLELRMKKDHSSDDLKSEFGRRGMERINTKIEEIEKKYGIEIAEEIYQSIGEAVEIRDHIMSKSFHEAGFSNGLQRALYEAGYHTVQDTHSLRLPISNMKDFKKYSLEQIATMGNMRNHIEELREKLNELGIVIQGN